MNSKSGSGFDTTFYVTLEQKYAVKLPGIPKLLIWATGLAMAIAFTIHDFLPLIKEYTDNNVAVHVQVVLLDNQFKPPQMVLALPRTKIRNKFGDDLMMMAMSLYRNGGQCGNDVHEICQELKRSSWNQELRFNYTSLESVYNNLTLAFVEQFFVNPEDEYSLNGIVMSSMMNYLEWISLVDYYLSSSRVEATIPFKLHPPPEFYERFENYDQKLDLLANHTLGHLCKRIIYTELEYPDEFRDPLVSNRTCTDLLFHSDFPVYVDGTGLWMSLSAVEGPKTKEYRFQIFPEKNHALINSSNLTITDTSSSAFLYGSPGILYQSVVDPVYSTYIFQTPVEEKKRGQRIFVRYKVQMRARETRTTKQPCLNETSVKACFVQCTRLWITEQCQCLPFVLKIGSAQPAMNYCTPISYAKCNIRKLPKEVTDSCMTKCQHPCGYTVYSWQISYESFDPLEADVHELTLKLVPMMDTFAEFTWTVKDTPEQFFSQLAGVGNFYLGFSGLSLFAVAIWLVDWWKRYKKLRLECAYGRDGQGVKDGWTISDGRKMWREDKEWLGQIEAELRTKWRNDMETMIKEQMSPREE